MFYWIRNHRSELFLGIVLGISINLLLVPRCSVAERQAGRQLENIDGWDLSSCVESSCGRETCLQMFLDNDTKILGGKTAIEAVFEFLFPLTQENDNAE